ncbi:MAG: AtpZ/AtpI family protein [Candidatus Omnitrophica bacterium]|nr:AtpZ/AtpI family protein [Candidatus Omnitrophota bacterium]
MIWQGVALRGLALLTELGLVIFFSIGIGIWIGSRIDRFFNTRGIFTVVFLFFGLIAAFLSAWRLIQKDKMV